MDALPGGPSESRAISDLESRRNKIASESAALLSKCVARPEPPMYTGLQVRQHHNMQKKRKKQKSYPFIMWFMYTHWPRCNAWCELS